MALCAVLCAEGFVPRSSALRHKATVCTSSPTWTNTWPTPMPTPVPIPATPLLKSTPVGAAAVGRRLLRLLGGAARRRPLHPATRGRCFRRRHRCCGVLRHPPPPQSPQSPTPTPATCRQVRHLPQRRPVPRPHRHSQGAGGGRNQFSAQSTHTPSLYDAPPSWACGGAPDHSTCGQPAAQGSLGFQAHNGHGAGHSRRRGGAA